MIKEFETPTIEVIKIEIQDIIATSPADDIPTGDAE